MDFKELVGLHALDGVDFDNTQVRDYGDAYEQCQVMRFRLDGTIYCAIEDPSDGYRSCMRSFAVEHGPMQNVFPPVQVVARHRTSGAHTDVDDVLELIDVVNGNVVLEVGTTNTDDYYPSFVAAFHPELMAVNQSEEAPDANNR